MSLQIDPSARRVVVTAGPLFSGRRLAEGVKRMIEMAPETASFDFVLDLRQTETGATQEDYGLVAQAYAAAPRTSDRKYTCFVTTDPNYPLWGQALQHLFPDRDHKFFATPESAAAFLDSARR
jgi:hypothetical protein